MGGNICFSIVNKSICQTAPFQKGEQDIPSIGGRFLNTQMGWCYWDKFTPLFKFIAYRTTNPTILPGDCLIGLRPSYTINNVPVAQSTSIEVRPNPFADQVTFTISLTENEKPISIEIFDLKGNKVDQILVTPKQIQYTWLPNSKIALGMYIAKLITDKGATQTRFLKAK